ncbi:sodium:proton antiporter [Actinacidiphila alni]|uniref:cation:proton antiporter n=1 Tax=Actinacidiphila alni TaxID=380248 RepID=UPI0033DD99AB
MDHQFLLVAAAALAIMICASVFARRTGVATPLLLVILGIGASALPGTPTVHIEPELVLAGVLPTLLYASAVQLPVLDVKRNLSLITWLSVVLVIVSALAIGAVVHAVFPGISFALATALGAVVSPTDAVAATAIGHRVGLPPRLMSVLEGESLVNDAAALVLLRTAVAGLATTSHFSPVHTVLDFGWAVLGALLTGLVVGFGTVLLRQRLDDPVLNTTISFAVPFLAYFPAEEIDASGVLAVVVAGLVTGTLGSKRFSARDRQTQVTTWATASFVLESGVFLAMGYQLPELVDAARSETSLGEMTGLVLIVVGLLIALRFLGLACPARQRHVRHGERTEEFSAKLDLFEQHLETVEPAGEREENRLAWARRRLARGRAEVEFEKREPLTRRGLLVIAWAGMRGVVTVAAAQTIPVDTPHRSTVILAAFFVALITLALFGLTLPGLIAAMRFPGESREDQRDATGALMRRIGGAAIDAVGPVEEQTIGGKPIDPEVATLMKERVVPGLIAATRTGERPPADHLDQMTVVQNRYLDAMRDALVSERSIGVYSSDTYRQVEALLDSIEHRVRRD